MMALWLVGNVLVGDVVVDVGGVGQCEYFGSWDRLDRYLPRLDSTVFLVIIFFLFFSLLFCLSIGTFIQLLCVCVCVFVVVCDTWQVRHPSTHTHTPSNKMTIRDKKMM